MGGGCTGTNIQGGDKFNKDKMFIRPEVKPFVPGTHNDDFDGYSGVDDKNDGKKYAKGSQD